MRRSLSWLVWGCAALPWVGVPQAAFAQTMKGDSAAIAMARRMIENMGGAAIWAEANWLYARENAWFGSLDSVVDAQFWRRTDAPAEWGRLHSPQVRRDYAWTADGGWQRHNGALRHFDRAEMQSRLGWWAGEIYVMYVRFARDDPGLRLVATGPRAFVALDDADGERLGEFHVNSRGELVRWVHRFGTDEEDYIYGPLKQFGPVRVPDWGANADGQFRFYYADFRLSPTPPDVSFTVPPG